jgi:hypothetical protein
MGAVVGGSAAGALVGLVAAGALPHAARISAKANNSVTNPGERRCNGRMGFLLEFPQRLKDDGQRTTVN